MKYKYSFDGICLGESDFLHHGDFGRWSCKDISSFGNNLEELLENAHYNYVDQDGGDVGDGPADDKDAVNFIKKWYDKKMEAEYAEHCKKYGLVDV